MIRQRWLVPLCCAAAVLTASPARAQEPGDVVVKLQKRLPTDPGLLRVRFLTDALVRITAAPGDRFSDRPSFVVPAVQRPAVAVRRAEVGNDVVVSSAQLKVTVNRRTGRVAFSDPSGRLLLRETAAGAKRLEAATVAGESTYHIRQLFDSPPDEAFYGLGQHQNRVLNYKGHAEDQWQYNSVISLPLLVSTRGYGILWDNNSETKFGDPRDWRPLNAVRVLDRAGTAGALTAEYFADKNFGKVLVTQRDSVIEHEYTDKPGSYPAGFQANAGSIRWTGSIQAQQAGTYHLRLWSSEYARVWIDGKQVLDRWRQNWHPWTDFFDLPLAAGQKATLRIDWVPNGGFIGLRALPPEPTETAGKLALSSNVADQIDYTFIRGENADSVIAGYRHLTGEAPMMPKSAFGLWQSRERYRTQDSVLSVVRTFRRLKIPFDNIVQDWFYWRENQWGSHEFDPERYPNPQAMMDTLHKDLHSPLMISIWAKFYENTANYKAFADSGWAYQHKIQQRQKDWVGPGYVSTFYDPFSPAARQLYFRQVRDQLVRVGIDGWWMDSNEPDMGDVPSPEERLARFTPNAAGTAARVELAYPLVHTCGFYENLRRTVPDRRVFILSRSAFGGQQRCATAVWSGDVSSRWESLKDQIPAGLNFSLAGMPYWTTDIGGFAPEPRYERPDSANLEEWRELMTRWFQFGTFNPLLRAHGQYPYREMFNVAPEDHPAYRAMRAYDSLRYRLMPYTYSVAGKVTQDGYTMMRALVMDFASDLRARDVKDEFLYGPALLVAPVTDYRARSRRVYLPAGTGWYDLRTGARTAGGQTVTAPAPYSDIPLFVREGSIIPVGPALQYTDEKPADPIRLYVFTGRDGAFTLYEDDGISYGYEQGAFSRIPIRWNQTARTLTIGARSGDYPGMLKSRTFEVVFVGPGQARGFDLAAPATRSVQYSGDAVVVRP